MNNESQTISIEAFFTKQLPVVELCLSNSWLLLYRFDSCIKTTAISFLHFVVLFFIFVTIYLQENSYRKLALHPKEEITSHCILLKRL